MGWDFSSFILVYLVFCTPEMEQRAFSFMTCLVEVFSFGIKGHFSAYLNKQLNEQDDS
jgi:hypothetical protein